MTDDWIRKVAERQLQREQEKMKATSAKEEQDEAFAATAAPFWSTMQVEIRRLLTEYNNAIGREDLFEVPETERVREGFKIRRGAGFSQEWCRIGEPSTFDRTISVEYHRLDGNTGTSHENKVYLEETQAEIHAAMGDGSAIGLAQAIFKTWVSGFIDRPPIGLPDEP